MSKWSWCCVNGLINPGKTELIHFGIRGMQQNCSYINHVFQSGWCSHHAFESYQNILNITLDSHLSRDKHVNQISHSFISRIRSIQYITPASGLVTAWRRDENYSLCVFSARVSTAPIPFCAASRKEKSINPLQRMQNSLASSLAPLLANLTVFVVTMLKQLYWLPIEYRIVSKIARLAFTARNYASPSYLSHLNQNYGIIMCLLAVYYWIVETDQLLYRRIDLRSVLALSALQLLPSSVLYMNADVQEGVYTM